MQEGIDCYRIQFPKGMDANEYALQVTPASKSLGVVIRSAVWLGAGKKKPITTESMNDEAAKNNNEEPSSLVADLEDVVNKILPASPLPDIPKDSVNADVSENDITINIEDRRYRIRGLHKNLSFDPGPLSRLEHNDDCRRCGAGLTCYHR